MYFCLYMRLWLHLVLCVAYSSGRANCQWKWFGRVGSGGIPVLHWDVKQWACENRKLNYVWVEFWPSPAPLVGYQWGRKVHALGQRASGQINMGWIWIRHRTGSQSGSEPYGEGRVSGPTLKQSHPIGKLWNIISSSMGACFVGALLLRMGAVADDALSLYVQKREKWAMSEVWPLWRCFIDTVPRESTCTLCTVSDTYCPACPILLGMSPTSSTVANHSI